MAQSAAQPKVKGKAFDWPLVRRILRYTRPYKGKFILALVFTLLLSLIAPAVPYLFQHVLDEPVVTGDILAVRTWIAVIFGLTLLRSVIMYFNSYLTGWLGQSIIRDVRTEVFNHIISRRPKFFDKSPVGMLQTRAISDVETLNEVFSQGLVSILGELLQLVAIFVVMMVMSWKLTLVIMTTMPLLFFSTWVFKNAIKSAFQGVRKYVSEMNTFLQEHISGMMITQLFHREKAEMGKFSVINGNLRNAHLKAVLSYSIFFPVIEIISALGIALLVWFGTGNVLSGHLSFGILVAFIMYIQMFFRPVRMLADRFNTLQLGMVSAERIFNILDNNEEIEDEGAIETLDKPETGISLDFEKVWFGYNEEEWVLRDVSFSAKPGEKIAIVGSTGAGKTTIINLLTRFYEINRGIIRVNGTNITELKLATLRGMIGLVLQDVFLFSGSILENITLNNPNISKERAIEAAKTVGADKFIRNLPGQYEYHVQERGATLSAGQRQLIAFARVLAVNPDILILDEATSNIDTESEELIQNAIEKIMQGRTSIIIAHRLSTIQKADKILVMSKGKIEESGSHQELLDMEGIYKRLYLLQFAENPLAAT